MCWFPSNCSTEWLWRSSRLAWATPWSLLSHYSTVLVFLVFTWSFFVLRPRDRLAWAASRSLLRHYRSVLYGFVFTNSFLLWWRNRLGRAPPGFLLDRCSTARVSLTLAYSPSSLRLRNGIRAWVSPRLLRSRSSAVCSRHSGLRIHSVLRRRTILCGHCVLGGHSVLGGSFRVHKRGVQFLKRPSLVRERVRSSLEVAQDWSESTSSVRR